MSAVCAISTPLSAGGISVVRISGEDAVSVAKAVFRPVFPKVTVEEMGGYTAAYGKISDGKEEIDDGVLLVFRAPHSYTGEDVCEISCHGGIYVTGRVMRACLNAGADAAGAGEFTKRALLNGKMSLTQAEAVADVISANGERALRYSNQLKDGALYRKTEEISGKIMDISAQIAAWIDFPEDDTPVVTAEWLEEKIGEVGKELDILLENYDKGKIVREGISCALCGKPNVGKSTLMNLLAKEERSIVSAAEGTTRDVVEENIMADGVVLRLMDCAGIRDTDDEVEKIGVERALKRLESADIALAVFDGSREFSDEDERLIELVKDKRTLAVVNKNDLETRLDIERIERALGKAAVISAKDEGAAERLAEAICDKFELKKPDESGAVLANERQRACALRARRSAAEAVEAVRAGVTPDVAGAKLDEALGALYELSGKSLSEEIIANVFERFCVGK